MLMLIANPMQTTVAAVDLFGRGSLTKVRSEHELGQHKLARVSLKAGCVPRIKELLGTQVASLMGDKFVGAGLLVRV